jgi:hypothetical protein
MAQLLITRRPYSVVKDRVFSRRNMSPLELRIVEIEALPPSGGWIQVPLGGDSRDRTGNLRLAKPALSQLSYIPEIGSGP